MTEREPLIVTVLGCGTSIGVPVVGCGCAVCTSDRPRNDRMRPGLSINAGNQVILVDTPTDLRRQCLRFGVHRVDAVLFTHAHADHIFGLDDLRPFNFRQEGPIPCLGSAATLERIRCTFSYAFEGGVSEGGGTPNLETVEIEGAFEVCGLEVLAVPVWHGSLEVNAYRVGPFAYVTDCHHIPESSFEALEGVEVLILDALRYAPHPTHFSLAEAVEVAERIGAEETYLTHMTHDIDYYDLAIELPPGVELAYDGLSLEIPF